MDGNADVSRRPLAAALVSLCAYAAVMAVMIIPKFIMFLAETIPLVLGLEYIGNPENYYRYTESTISYILAFLCLGTVVFSIVYLFKKRCLKALSVASTLMSVAWILSFAVLYIYRSVSIRETSSDTLCFERLAFCFGAIWVVIMLLSLMPRIKSLRNSYAATMWYAPALIFVGMDILFINIFNISFRDVTLILSIFCQFLIVLFTGLWLKAFIAPKSETGTAENTEAVGDYKVTGKMTVVFVILLLLTSILMLSQIIVPLAAGVTRYPEILIICGMVLLAVTALKKNGGFLLPVATFTITVGYVIQTVNLSVYGITFLSSRLFYSDDFGDFYSSLETYMGEKSAYNYITSYIAVGACLLLLYMSMSYIRGNFHVSVERKLWFLPCGVYTLYAAAKAVSLFRDNAEFLSYVVLLLITAGFWLLCLIMKKGGIALEKEKNCIKNDNKGLVTGGAICLLLATGAVFLYMLFCVCYEITFPSLYSIISGVEAIVLQAPYDILFICFAATAGIILLRKNINTAVSALLGVLAVVELQNGLNHLPRKGHSCVLTYPVLEESVEKIYVAFGIICFASILMTAVMLSLKNRDKKYYGVLAKLWFIPSVTYFVSACVSWTVRFTSVFEQRRYIELTEWIREGSTAVQWLCVSAALFLLGLQVFKEYKMSRKTDKTVEISSDRDITKE